MTFQSLRTTPSAHKGSHMRLQRYILMAGVIVVAETTSSAATGLPTSHISNKPTPIPGIGGPFNLIDDNGRKVSAATLAGKPSAIFFGYTFCPEVCPTTLQDMTSWISALGSDAGKINYVFVTIDPHRDTPKVMHQYLSSFDRRIRGFSGTDEQTAKIAREYGAYYKRVPAAGGSYVMNHSDRIYLMNAQGQYVGSISYREPDASAISKLKQLLQ